MCICLFCMFCLYGSAHSFQCVKWFLLPFVGRAHWRAACSAAGCQGLNRAASEVRFRGENIRSIRAHGDALICYL